MCINNITSLTFGNNIYTTKEGMKNKVSNEYIIANLKNNENHLFPYRYFQDEKDNVLPIVAVTGFFREDKAKELYYDYIKNGIFVFGITAYKSFPRKIDKDDAYHLTDDFDYVKNIKNWLCCFRDPYHYGFTSENNYIDISESDMYDVDTTPDEKKEYDFIYICIKDDDTCPADGWNAINRNFKLAKECLPILIHEYNLKGLIVGRVGCGLEQEYGDRVEVVDFLDWFELQKKMKQSRFLFLPNIYDASPRVIAECLTKGVPVLMNQSILCGFKYMTYETGEFFVDVNDIRISLDSLLSKIEKINPKKWWSQHYGKSKTAKKIRDFLYPSCHEVLENVKEVLFYN
jgi:hypothetical protein